MKIERFSIRGVYSRVMTAAGRTGATLARRHPVLALLVLWTSVSLALGTWGWLAGPPSGGRVSGSAGGLTVLAHPPDPGIVTVWLHWQAPPGESGWVVLEAGRAWSDTAGAYWRRRVHQGWNQLVWDDFSAFPAAGPVRLRMLEGRGTWTIALPTVSSRYTPAQLGSLRGLLAALILGVSAGAALFWRGLPSALSARPRRWHWGLLAVAGVALGLRGHTLTLQSLWFDEVLTAIGAQSFAWVLYAPEIFGHPPWQYLVGWITGGAQASEAWLRAPFVAAGVAGVIAVAYLGRRLLGATTGLVAAGLLAVSPFHVELSQLARPYAFLLLGVTLSLLALFRALDRGTAADWVCFSCAAALALYTHYLAGTLLVIEALGTVAWVARRRGEGGWQALVSFAAIGVLLAPWAAVLMRLLGGQLGEGHASAGAIGSLVTGAVIPQFLGAGASGAVAGALTALGLWRLRRHPEIALVVILWFTLPLVVLWAARPAHFLAGRHLAFMLPVLVCVVAHGLVGAARFAGDVVGRVLGPRRAWAREAGAALAAFGLVLTWTVPATASLDEYYRWRRGTDWRTVAAVLDQAVAPRDDVVATLGAAYPLRHYWRRSVTEIDARGLRDRYRRTAAGRRLWIVTLEGWDRAPALHEWLAGNAVRAGEVPASWSLPHVSIYRAPGGLR